MRSSAISIAPSLLVVLLAMAQPTRACSCALGGTAATEFQSASAVFFAKTITSQRAADSQGRLVERAQLKVLESWKGRHRVGEIVEIRSNVGDGACGKSVINDPPWLELVDRTRKPRAPKLSGRWVIYAYGTAPYEISLCSRSRPIEAGGEDERREIRSHAEKWRREGGSRPNTSLERTRER
jgi:hypothetical protein